MPRVSILVAGVCLLPTSALAMPELPDLEFPARMVGFEREVPPAGVVYVRLGRALTRADIRAAADADARYLGLVARRTYAFELTGPSAATFLRGFDPVLGVAKSQPQDKLQANFAALLGAGQGVAETGLGLTVAFYPHATLGELRTLLGESVEGRLPTTADAPLGVDSVFVVPAEVAKWLALDRLLASPAVASVGLDIPKVLTNDSSRDLAGSDALYSAPFGLSGSGILLGHWDGGRVDTDHPDFGTRVTNLDQSEVDSHATHTAGTVLGSGTGRASAAGHAPGARMVALSFNGNPTAERREVKHRVYHHHDNHSWGVDSRVVNNFGTYNQVALEFDIDARDLLLLPVKAAGNDGQRSEVIVENFGFDSLSPDSTAKNSMVVGATDANGQLAGFSSRGPTEDGRVKPDVVAVGAGVVSTRPGGGYFRAQGTSMSTPGVTGMLALVAEMFERDSSGRRMAPDVARGLMIHTARDTWNLGPDFRFGWGIADARAAVEHIVADRANGGRSIVRGAVRTGERAEYLVDVAAGSGPLKITLSWLDAFLNTTANRRLLNDIDLVLISPSGQRSLPWVLDRAAPLADATRGRNSVDNVEQVVVDDPEAGRWMVVVEGTDVSDPDLFVQGFVLLSERPLQRELVRVAAPSGASVPDGQGSLELRFEVSPASTVEALRVFLDLQHEARGQVRIELEHPDGTAVTLETEDRSTRRDIYAVYPDLRSYDDDVTSLYGKSANGQWILRIRDLETGEVGEVRHAELEIDLGGPPNQLPTAVILAATEGPPGEVLTLSGASSSDPDGDALTFAWTQTAGPQAMLEGVTTDTARVTLPDAPAGTTLDFELLVDDARGGQASATHTVTLTDPNQAPKAAVDGPGEARIGSEVRFDASGSSDADGDSLTYTWTQTDGPRIAGTPARGVEWVFTVPDTMRGQRFELLLTVEDGRGGQSVVPFSLVALAREETSGGGSGGDGSGSGSGDGSGDGRGDGQSPGGSLEGAGCRAQSGSGLSLPVLFLIGAAGLWRRRLRARP